MRLLIRLRAVAVVIAVAVSAAALPPSARAEIPWCTGTITAVYVDNAGNVTARPSWRNDWIVYCNLNTTRGNVTPKTCSSWYAALLLAYQTQKSTITAYWGDAVTTCASWATYGYAPVPSYFMVQ